MQRSWAEANNAVLLAANANDNQRYGPISGSGIYSGHVAPLDTYAYKKDTNILIANVPHIAGEELVDTEKIPTKASGGGVAVENLSSYKIKMLNFNGHKHTNGTICDGSICCMYSIDVTESESVYRFVSLLKFHWKFVYQLWLSGKLSIKKILVERLFVCHSCLRWIACAPSF